MIRFLLNDGELGQFAGVAAIEIDSRRYTPEEVVAIVRGAMSRHYSPTSLTWRRNWRHSWSR